jgi:ribosomal-protein-alanine N-acetyltransferase
MADVIMRKMTEQDLPEVVAIEKAIFSDPWSLNAFKSDLNNEMAWPIAATHEGIVIAYSCLYIVANEMQIGNFAVAPEYRKRGIGRLLMNQVMSLANERKCEVIFLEVRESNKSAQALYGSFNFKPVGRRTGYYRSPVENAIIMIKEL